MSSNDSDEGVASSDEGNTSELGTKNFWDQQYVTELKNFNEFGDIGQIWFGKKLMDTIVNWLAAKIDKKSSVLDLGCGNGILLIQLVFSQIFRIYKFLKFLALKIFPSYPLGFFLLFYEAWI